MTLEQVLAGVRLRTRVPDTALHLEVHGLDYDSRRVEPGFLFFAFAGARADGRAFARSAMERGALAVVSEHPKPEDVEGVWIEVEHGRQALALAAKNFSGAPDERLCLTGITGTNGKTTTAFLTDAILRSSGRVTALVGTIEYRLAGQVLAAVNTTPESLDLYRLLQKLVHAGGSHATMEVSSHALALGRVYGITFHTAVFTNLTRDHLDFHHTMDDYFAAKTLLFRPEAAAPPRWAVINQDDPYGREIRTLPETRVVRYGFEEGAGLRAGGLRMGFEGLHFTIAYGGESIPISSPLIGRINAYNIMAACGAALSYGLGWDAIRRGIEECSAVPGRFERVDSGQPFMVVVDYAHTDDALKNVIEVARGLKPQRVITLFGCGGDRDRTKRPLMGMAAAQASDFVVLTSDNPRSEDPLDIINDVLVGLRRYDTAHIVEPDREKAINAALKEARPGDIVILAGKGHEPYQVLSDRTISFDDRAVARDILRSLGYKGGP
jgi:UDP-N-acetylmuramoyl-L-alanyl-D-glutamate--2,6-diaminopimelate ligase